MHIQKTLPGQTEVLAHRKIKYAVASTHVSAWHVQRLLKPQCWENRDPHPTQIPPVSSFRLGLCSLGSQKKEQPVDQFAPCWSPAIHPQPLLAAAIVESPLSQLPHSTCWELGAPVPSRPPSPSATSFLPTTEHFYKLGRRLAAGMHCHANMPNPCTRGVYALQRDSLVRASL